MRVIMSKIFNTSTNLTILYFIVYNNIIIIIIILMITFTQIY